MRPCQSQACGWVGCTPIDPPVQLRPTPQAEIRRIPNPFRDRIWIDKRRARSWLIFRCSQSGNLGRNHIAWNNSLKKFPNQALNPARLGGKYSILAYISNPEATPPPSRNIRSNPDLRFLTLSQWCCFPPIAVFPSTVSLAQAVWTPLAVSPIASTGRNREGFSVEMSGDVYVIVCVKVCGKKTLTFKISGISWAFGNRSLVKAPNMGLLQPAPAVIGAVSLTAIVGLGTPKESATSVDCQDLRNQ